jgi:hypothetical protein
MRAPLNNRLGQMITSLKRRRWSPQSSGRDAASCCELAFVSGGGKENERNCVHSCHVVPNFFPSRPLPYN